MHGAVARVAVARPVIDATRHVRGVEAQPDEAIRWDRIIHPVLLPVMRVVDGVQNDAGDDEPAGDALEHGGLLKQVVEAGEVRLAPLVLTARAPGLGHLVSRDTPVGPRCGRLSPTPALVPASRYLARASTNLRAALGAVVRANLRPYVCAMRGKWCWFQPLEQGYSPLKSRKTERRDLPTSSAISSIDLPCWRNWRTRSRRISARSEPIPRCVPTPVPS